MDISNVRDLLNDRQLVSYGMRNTSKIKIYRLDILYKISSQPHSFVKLTLSNRSINAPDKI